MEKIKNVLQKYVNTSSRFQSPILPCYDRISDFDKDGKEIVSYVPSSIPDMVKSLGSSENWKLNALVSAGINPNFSIHTGNSSRLDGYKDLVDAVKDANSIIDNVESSKTVE